MTAADVMEKNDCIDQDHKLYVVDLNSVEVCILLEIFWQM